MRDPGAWTYFLCNWIPIVASPVPDVGFPLHIKIELSLHNLARDTNKFNVRAAIVDNKPRSYSSPLSVRPNFKVLFPWVSKPSRAYSADIEKILTGKNDIAGERVPKAGEIWKIELTTHEGSSLPAGSRIHVQMGWSDNRGNTVVLRTADRCIERNDWHDRRNLCVIALHYTEQSLSPYNP